MSTRASRDPGSAGFTLAEVLIALALLAVAGIAAVGLLATLSRSSVDGRTQVMLHATAVAVMESLLVRDFDALPVAATSGSAADGIAWTIAITDESAGLRRLSVAVASDGRSLTLESLRSDRE